MSAQRAISEYFGVNDTRLISTTDKFREILKGFAPAKFDRYFISTEEGRAWFWLSNESSNEGFILDGSKLKHQISRLSHPIESGQTNSAPTLKAENEELKALNAELLEALKELKFTLSGYMADSEAAMSGDYELLEKAEALITKATAK